ncbi:hypothetical protein C8J57DRAFT_1508440 [Mycena rebaudengoi]|nr:hypothetical protein C8J57DRAFT_1508440 [Mycena rebaudengoi]
MQRPSLNTPPTGNAHSKSPRASFHVSLASHPPSRSVTPLTAPARRCSTRPRCQLATAPRPPRSFVLTCALSCGLEYALSGVARRRRRSSTSPSLPPPPRAEAMQLCGIEIQKVGEPRFVSQRFLPVFALRSRHESTQLLPRHPPTSASFYSPSTHCLPHPLLPLNLRLRVALPPNARFAHHAALAITSFLLLIRPCTYSFLLARNASSSPCYLGSILCLPAIHVPHPAPTAFIPVQSHPLFGLYSILLYVHLPLSLSPPLFLSSLHAPTSTQPLIVTPLRPRHCYDTFYYSPRPIHRPRSTTHAYPIQFLCFQPTPFLLLLRRHCRHMFRHLDHAST